MDQVQETPQREMPRYKSHKTVWALKIADIQQSPADELSTVDGGTWRLIPTDPGYGPITVPHSYVVKHNPQPGGYYVVYADGYASFSPAQAFEEGNTLILPGLEESIKALGADRAPRVTPADIEAEIVTEHFFTAQEGVFGAARSRGEDCVVYPSLPLLTVCVLVLRNGFTVTGESACASPDNFNAEIGRRIARENAVAKIWPLLGFRLRDKLAAAPADFRDRMQIEKRDLDEKITRLSAFLVTEKFETLNFAEQANLLAQRTAMTAYSDILGIRIETAV